MRSNASTLSCVPVTSTITVRRCTSMIFPRKISTTCMISPRDAASAEILNSAISRATASSGSRSRILSTLTSLCSCLVTWSIGCIAPSTVSVMREDAGLVLDQDRQHVLAAGAHAGGGIELLERQQLLSAWLAHCSPHHVARGLAGRDHRVHRLL